MKKRWLAIGLTAAMITSMAACGGSSSTASKAESKPAESAATESKPAAESKAATESKTESKPAAAGDEGKVLNVEGFPTPKARSVMLRSTGSSQRTRTMLIRTTWMRHLQHRLTQLLTRRSIFSW